MVIEATDKHVETENNDIITVEKQMIGEIRVPVGSAQSAFLPSGLSILLPFSLVYHSRTSPFAFRFRSGDLRKFLPLLLSLLSHLPTCNSPSLGTSFLPSFSLFFFFM